MSNDIDIIKFSIEGKVAYFNLPTMRINQGSQVVIYTPALDICSCGDDLEQAKNNFRDAVIIFLEDLVENNNLDLVLEELGWFKDLDVWMPPAWQASSFGEMFKSKHS